MRTLGDYHDTSHAISLNDRAAVLAEELIARAAELSVAVHRLANGATVIDCGARTVGSHEAGRIYAEACMGGLADVRLTVIDLEGWPVPGVQVDVRHPLLACMASQLAGWAIEVPRSGDDPGYYALGSGPARALCRRERVFESITHQEEARAAVLSMESWDLPTERVADLIAQGCCRLSAEGVYLLVAPTASPGRLGAGGGQGGRDGPLQALPSGVRPFHGHRRLRLLPGGSGGGRRPGGGWSHQRRYPLRRPGLAHHTL